VPKLWARHFDSGGAEPAASAAPASAAAASGGISYAPPQEGAAASATGGGDTSDARLEDARARAVYFTRDAMTNLVDALKLLDEDDVSVTMDVLSGEGTWDSPIDLDRPEETEQVGGRRTVLKSDARRRLRLVRIESRKEAADD
jgi:hypothetical protein